MNARTLENPMLYRNFIKSIRRKVGHDIDHIDLEEIDRTLEPGEAMNELEEKHPYLNLGHIHRKSDPISEGMEDLQRIHDERSSHARRIDGIKKAKTVFKNPFDSDIGKWMRDPHRYDVMGIDTPKRKRRRKK